MATDLALPRGDENVVGPHRPRARNLPAFPEEAGFPEATEFNLGTLLRIIREWRWVIVGAVALGLAAAIIITLLTQPL